MIQNTLASHFANFLFCHQQSAELGPADRKRFKKATYSEIEHLLLAWISAVRERHERVNGPIIQAKGLSFARELRIESFTASSGATCSLS